uniref:autotransporter-associated beta strand repeat-containing protein n=1 Tax=Candidatus Odyssella thessalonicensis TaxID=84647 RepID=UPI000527FCAA
MLRQPMLTVTSALTLANPITLTTNGTINTQADVTASGAVTGTGILTKTGANTLTMTGASSFGGTTISAGTVTFSAAANVGTTVSLNGGKLQLTASAPSAVTLASPSITASGGTIENLSTQTLTLTSSSGTGALIKNGSGPLTLSGASSRSGTTTVNAGGLRLDHYQSLGSGNLTLATNTSLELAGNIGSANPVANAIAITGPVTVDSKGYTGYFNGPITGAQALTVQGSGGTVVVGGTNTPSSTTVTSGTLALLNSSSSFSNPVNVGSGATFDISQGPATPTLANVTTVVGSNIKLGSQALSLTSGTIAGNLLDGGISGTTGATLTKTGGGILTLTGTNTYAGGTILQAGTININNIHALGTGALNYAI